MNFKKPITLLLQIKYRKSTNWEKPFKAYNLNRIFVKLKMGTKK